MMGIALIIISRGKNCNDPMVPYKDPNEDTYWKSLKENKNGIKLVHEIECTYQTWKNQVHEIKDALHVLIMP